MARSEAFNDDDAACGIGEYVQHEMVDGMGCVMGWWSVWSGIRRGAWPGWGLLGWAGLGTARHGRKISGRRSMARHGTAWHGMARQGTAGHGRARESTVQLGTAQLGTPQHTNSQHITARLGTARRGMAQHSTAQAQHGPGRSEAEQARCSLVRTAGGRGQWIEIIASHP